MLLIFLVFTSLSAEAKLTADQELAVANSALAKLAAKAYEKALEENPASTEAQIRFVFRRLTGRQPEQTETRLLTELLREQGAMFEKEPERAEKLIPARDYNCVLHFILKAVGK